MARRPAARNAAGKPRTKRKKRKKRSRLARLWPTATTRRRWLRRFRRTPGPIRVVTVLAVVAVVGLATNWIYQVIRKPSELFFPVSGTLFKTPPETWRSYAPIFRKHSTHAISPELLAALAQVEGAGNPVARTYWRWSWKLKPFEIYRPATSAVGMYQMTNGTFAEAKHYCVHDHVIATEGTWDDLHSCWLNSLYFRVIPSHSVELTAAYLDVHVASTLARNRIAGATPQQKQHLAATIHLCGAGVGDLYARHGFHFAPGQRCGDHDPRVYLARVDAMKSVFARLAQE
ncbi:MAG: lytic transglycosylase domain-containing protein [Steroidobacteraceae bacterium]